MFKKKEDGTTYQKRSSRLSGGVSVKLIPPTKRKCQGYN